MTSRNSRSQYLFYKQESQIRFISVVVKGMHKFIFKNLNIKLGRSLAALGRAPRIVALQSIFDVKLVKI